MQKIHFFLILSFLSGTAFNACAKEKEPARPAPVLKFSVPSNGDSGASVSSSIVFTFDEVISLTSEARVTVNQLPVEATTQLTELTLKLALEPETHYSVHIPKSAIQNTFDVLLEEDIRVEFTTQKSGEVAFDKNFYIFVCFGQSNMEGQGAIEALDRLVDDRFQVLQALDCDNLEATKGQWRTAVPPLCQCYSGLSPADYFGRTLVENLPDSITIGVINVAVGGCDIRLFDKDQYAAYDSTYTDPWFTEKIQAYGGNPYEHLMQLAKQAQERGVIKGILLHQGETNTGDTQWPEYVKKVYMDMLNDLSLEAEKTPLLAGETVNADQGEVCCASMNAIIATLPEVIPGAQVISSAGCTAQDNAHFDAEGYRKLGRRYAEAMLPLLQK